MTMLGRGVAAARGMRPVLSVTGFAADTPLDTSSRAQYCGFVFDLLARYPSVNDVKIWNEPNTSRFWRPQFNPDGTSNAPEAYEELLVRCYDLLHTLRPKVNVIGGSTSARGNDNPAADVPSHSPGAFIRGIGAAYRDSGRQRPIFDTYAHHPYPENSGEPPSKEHPGGKSIGEGDYDRLMEALSDAFRGTAQPLPGLRGVTIWYTEDGFQTTVDPAKAGLYDGQETDPFAVAADGAHAAQLAEAVRLAYCQPAVGAFFNFELADERALAGWQSGVLWADWTPKPSYGAFKQVIAEVAARSVDCGKFAWRPGPSGRR